VNEVPEPIAEVSENQEILDDISIPSSASDAVPTKLTDSPIRKTSLSDGDVIVTTGGSFPVCTVMSTVATLDVAPLISSIV